MAELNVTRKVGLPYHDKHCGMVHSGNPYCTPCAVKQKRLWREFWKTMDETSARGGTVDAHG